MGVGVGEGGGRGRGRGCCLRVGGMKAEESLCTLVTLHSRK